MNVARLVVSVPDSRLRDALGVPPEGVVILKWDLSGPAPTTSIDIVVPPYLGTVDLLAQLVGVTTRLVQSQSVGYDGVEGALPAGIVYANAASVHETSTAELALALILAAQRGIPDFVRDAAARRWAPRFHPGLADHTVLLLGYGGVGQAIEARLENFETSIIRVARTERTDRRGPVYGVDAVGRLLERADVVVVSVPLTAATTNLVDRTFLSHMRDGSLLVNVARGAVADTQALIAEAATGRLRLALDVTNPEPLPEDHLFFEMANVLISPHVGGATAAMRPRMARLVNEQITRMLDGEEPRNVVLRT